jgi:hypothetical protein
MFPYSRIFFLRYIFGIKVKNWRVAKMYPLTGSHTENLQTPVVGLMECYRCPWEKGKKTYESFFLPEISDPTTELIM